MTFKVGDKVRRIYREGFGIAKYGEVYTVSEVAVYGHVGSIRLEGDTRRTYDTDSFELVEEHKEVSTKVPHVHAELIKQWVEDSSLEVQALYDGEWVTILLPIWYPQNTYRLVKSETKPCETKPSIDWSHVSKNMKYMATDSNGESYLFEGKPSQGSCTWGSHQGCSIKASNFTSYKAGTCDWKNSLVERPEGV